MMIVYTCQFIYEMYQATVDIDISIQYITVHDDSIQVDI